MDQDCIFCKIGSGEVEADILYRDDNCFVIRDIAPKAPTHLLIIPSEHFTYLREMTQDFSTVLGSMFIAAKGMAESEGVDETGYRLVINQGADSGQDVPHLHMHLLGGRRLGRMG